jgi:osmoprotectant transport system ATP-binding protein
MIDIDALTKWFGSSVAVDRLSLTVRRGELLVLLGGSGCGKTTTLKMVNRLIEPTAGHVRIDGVDTATVLPHELRRHIGYCFQRIGLFPHFTVAENIAVTPRLIGWEPTRTARRVDELLELVELDSATFRHRYPAELSGGQQQRVGVARALAAEPGVMLLDEPFGALDPLTRDRLQQSFQEIRRRLNLTAMFVTHDMVEALLLGDRIAVMRAGQLVQIGTPHELLHDPADEYVAELMATPSRQADAVASLRGNTEPVPTNRA